MYFFDMYAPLSSRPLCTDDTGRLVTYGDWYTHAATVATYIRPRALAAIICRNTAGSLLSYLSCLQNRIVPLMLDPAVAPELQEKLLRRYEPEYIFQPRNTTSAHALYTLADYGLYHTKATPCPLHPDLALLLTTSGSTGSPKLVRQSYRNLQANAASIAAYLNLQPDQYPISSLPMHYTFGLSVIHSHLYCGAAIRLTENTVFDNGFWDICRDEKVTSLAGVPFTYACLDKLGFQNMDLPHLTLLLQAGGRLGEPLHKKFGTYAQEKNKRFIVMYGQTEATARMSYLPAAACLKKIGSIGIAIPGGFFRIMENETEEITVPEQPGELYYEGDNVTLGYAETRADLQKGDERHGRLFTGDIAYKDEDGYFYIVGRKKRFIKLTGKRFNLDEAEQLLKNSLTTGEVACTGKDEQLQIYTTASQELPALEAILQHTLQLLPRQYVLQVVNTIPKNSSGKIQYTRLTQPEAAL